MYFDNGISSTNTRDINRRCWFEFYLNESSTFLVGDDQRCLKIKINMSFTI